MFTPIIKENKVLKEISESDIPIPTTRTNLSEIRHLMDILPGTVNNISPEYLDEQPNHPISSSELDSCTTMYTPPKA